MNRSALAACCGSRAGASSDFPFGPEVEVFRVGGRIFALITTAGPLRISLKCDPVLAEILRANHPAVTPGYHLNKRHWNTVVIDGSVPETETHEMVDHSHALIVSSLPRSKRPT